jgi:hypothetical protein
VGFKAASRFIVELEKISPETVITGFNTDIEHNGVIYHVQTEDKGLDSPIILSLVYAGGTILASKRSPYEDLIAEGFSDEVLAERLKRQHRLICAAIHSGRIDDLKKMSTRHKGAAQQEEIVQEMQDEILSETPPEVEAATPSASDEEALEIEYWPMTQEWTPPPPTEELPPPVEAESTPDYLIGEEMVNSSLVEESEPEGLTEELLEDGLVITLLDEDQFYSGERYTLRVLIATRVNGEEKPLANAAVSIKILGTMFRPLIYSLKTESDGVATVSTEIPQFSSGRAAVLVRAVTKDEAAELRRIIHQKP